MNRPFMLQTAIVFFPTLIVLPGLFVGNYRDSKDACQLDRHKISHIIAIHDAARRLHSDKEYLCIMASDSPYQNLAQYFATCNDFIHNARIQGGSVLIHCLAGMSRSVTIAVAYIMSITSMRWNEALKVVRGARAVSNPNSGFQKQLQDFEATRLLEERRRMAEKFPGTTFLESEEEHCKRLLLSYNNLLLSRAICEGRCSSPRVCPTGSCRHHHSAHASPGRQLTRQRSGERLEREGTPMASSSSPVHRPATCPSPAIRSVSRGSLSRGLSSESSTSVGSPSRMSPNTSTSSSPLNSPKSWERHYGCWKNHVRSQEQLQQPSQASPVHYRVSKDQRSESMTSICSNSSVGSLPPSDGRKVSFVPSLAASTRSCPNSPRRTPKKLPRTGSIREEDSVLRIEVEEEVQAPLRSTAITTTAPRHSFGWRGLPRVPTPVSQSIRYGGQTIASTSIGVVSLTSSTPAHSSNPPLSYLSHVQPKFSGSSSGSTRWVMKRSAFKYTMDHI